MKPNFKSDSGVTIIVLMITIITLVILSGITIYTIVNFDMVTNAINARLKSDIKTVYEQLSESINVKRLEGEDVSILELRLDAIDELQNAEPDIHEKIQNMNPEILSMLIISQGEVKYIREEVNKYCQTNEIGEGIAPVYDEDMIEELLKYFEELGIEEYIQKEANTIQQVSKVLIIPGGEPIDATKTKITKNILNYEYQIVVVLDLSASMRYGLTNSTVKKDTDKTQRLYVAKNATNTFITSLFNSQDTAQLKVVTFNYNDAKKSTNTNKYSGTMDLIDINGATVLEENNGVARNGAEAEVIKKAINDITLPSNLGTYYIDALKFAKKALLEDFTSTYRTNRQVEETFDAITITNTTYDNKKIMIFVSDGQPTDNKTTITNTAKSIRNSDGIDIYTIGFTSSVDTLKNMSSTNADGKKMYFTAADADSLVKAFNDILEYVATQQGKEAVLEETIIEESEVSDVGSVTTSGSNLLTYEIFGGVLDKTSPIEICKKEGDEYVVIRTYYVNNLPPSITYDGKAVYWDLTKEDESILSEDIALRFDVVDVNNKGNIDETDETEETEEPTN